MNNKDIYHQHGYTKHYYVEADRIASKIGGGMSHSGNDFGEHIYVFNISTQNDYGRKSEENAKNMYNHLDSAQSNVGSQFDILVDIDYRIIRKFTETDEEERHIFFFHKDHLGSSTQITDMGQHVVHHIEYMPTGELFAEQRDYWHTPYRFNGKELDEETGLYYYGARYYTPEVGIWLSVDPQSDKRSWLSPYNYCQLNPVRLVDPDGELDWQPEVGNSGEVRYKAEKDDNISTFMSQYSLSHQPQKAFAIFNAAGLDASTSDLQGQSISGDAVKKVTGSDVLKLDWSSPKATEQRIADQVMFAIKNEQTNGNYITDMKDYNKNFQIGSGGVIIQGVNISVGNERIPIESMSLGFVYDNTQLMSYGQQMKSIHGTNDARQHFYSAASYNNYKSNRPMLTLRMNEKYRERYLNYYY